MYIEQPVDWKTKTLSEWRNLIIFGNTKGDFTMTPLKSEMGLVDKNLSEEALLEAEIELANQDHES